MQIELVRPFPISALPRVWRWVEAHRDRIADDYFVKSIDEFIDTWAPDGQARVTWGVRRDGELGGIITTCQKGPIVWDLHCVFSKEFWGHKTTIPALTQACEIIFGPRPDGLGADKIESSAFSDNMAVISLMRALGGTKEGLLRGHTKRGGVLVDVVLMGLQEGQRRVFRNQSQLDEPGHEPSRQQPLQPERHERLDDGKNSDARPDAGADPDQPAHPRASDEPGSVPGPGSERRAQPGQQ